MNYRADIQILRGLAVLFVVCFHMNFEVARSGFLGVDIFFVVSGFLMAVLYDSREKKLFLMRRAQRLLPAYYAVILVTLVVSFLINTKNETDQVVAQALFGATHTSNIGFWLQNSYFSKSEFNPLLHLWSLSVEIQFYLLIPIFAWFFSKNKYGLVILLMASLCLCLFVTGKSPKTSFFMMPLRVWEFLVGYGAAIFFTNHGSIRETAVKWPGAVGMVLLLLIPAINVDGQSLDIVNGHPGLAAIFVTLATGLVLVYGLPNTVVTSAIGRCFEKLGDYSYSIYLAHFPIIVLYLSAPFAGTVLDISTVQDFAVVLVLIAILSILLHKFVEIRFKGTGVWKVSGIYSVLILLFSLILPIMQKKMLSTEELNIYNAFQDRSAYRCGKLFRISNPNALSCELAVSQKDFDKRLLLVGNSHADSIKTALAEVAEESEVSVHFIVQNNPLMVGGLPAQSVFNEAVANEIGTIVLHFSPSSVDPEAVRSLVEKAQKVDIEVIYIDPVPVWSENIPELMYEIQQERRSKALVKTKQEYLSDNQDLDNWISGITSDNFKRMSTVDYFCQPQCMYQTAVAVPLYFDSGHLTLTGSYVLRNLFLEIVDALEK